MSHPRRTVVAALACALVLVAGLGGCKGGTPTSSSSVAPFVPAAAPTSAEPSPSPSPSASPSASPSPSRPPSAPPTSRKPTAAATSHAPQSTATGHGPAGSMSVTGDTTVALTFDDGPDPDTTPRLLALLRQYHVKATFCLIGYRARDYPDLVRQIVADGHTLCNHSWQHLTNLGSAYDATYQTNDLTHTNQVMQSASPGARVPWFRAPGGNFTSGLVSVATSLNMGSLYWSVDPRDWDNATYGTGASMRNHIVSVVESQVRPGSIILSHDRKEHPDTIPAYEILLPWLLARYQLVAL
jgi:peptidoglycan-N-acetylglucosamine deacetylase